MNRPGTPIGIKIVCLVWVLFALLNIIQIGQVLSTTRLSGELLIPIGLITVLSVAYIVVSIGLWKTRTWAWKGAIGLVVIGSVTALLQGIFGLPIGFLLVLVGIYLVIRRDVFTAGTTAAS